MAADTAAKYLTANERHVNTLVIIYLLRLLRLLHLIPLDKISKYNNLP
jgi:hypothetical protein